MLHDEEHAELDDLHMALMGTRYIGLNHATHRHRHHRSLSEDDDDSDLDDQGVHAMTLTTLLHSGAEEVLNSLSADQLIELGKNVRKLKKEKTPQQQPCIYQSSLSSPPPSTKRKAAETSSGQQAKSQAKAQLSSRSAGSASRNAGHLEEEVNIGNGDEDEDEDEDEDVDKDRDKDSKEAVYGMLSVASGRENSDHRYPGIEGSVRSNESTHGSGSSAGGLNLPASQPITDVREGIEYLIFTYSTKGHIQEFTIRVDIDNMMSNNLPEDFKRENCVYPRACTTPEAYIGNRYEYETTVNDLAWRLTWLNPDTLSGKRGLIQRAVDSYRNRFQESRSRRIVRQEKINNGTLRRRTIDSHAVTLLESHTLGCRPHGAGSRPSQVTIQYKDKRGKLVKARVRLDIDRVDMNVIDETFRANNCLFPNAMVDRELYENGEDMYAFECAMNELGWKLAYLNPSKLSGKKAALMVAIEVFRDRYGPFKYENLVDSGQGYGHPLHSNMIDGADTALSGEDLPSLSQVHGFPSHHSMETGYHHPMSYSDGGYHSHAMNDMSSAYSSHSLHLPLPHSHPLLGPPNALDAYGLHRDVDPYGHHHMNSHHAHSPDIISNSLHSSMPSQFSHHAPSSHHVSMSPPSPASSASSNSYHGYNSTASLPLSPSTRYSNDSYHYSPAGRSMSVSGFGRLSPSSTLSGHSVEEQDQERR